jgi:hypothetical protein
VVRRFPGIYETDYGNTAFVNAADVKQAWDLDMKEWVPIELVDLDKFLRDPVDADMPLDDMFGDLDLSWLDEEEK